MKIFIASSSKNIVEEKVSITSMLSSNNNKKDIFVLSADENKIYNYNRTRVIGPIYNYDIKLDQTTAFSLARFFVPLIMINGRENENVVIIDPDTLVFKDLNLFFKIITEGIYMRKAYAPGLYASSVIFYTKQYFNNERLIKYKNAVLNSKISWTDKLYFSKKFRDQCNIKVMNLSKSWNHFDVKLPNTKIIHFTNLYNQPWVFDNHPFENLWLSYMNNAINEGLLKIEDIKNQQNQIVTFDDNVYACKKNIEISDSKTHKYNFFPHYKFLINEIKFHSIRRYLYNFL